MKRLAFLLSACAIAVFYSSFSFAQDSSKRPQDITAVSFGHVIDTDVEPSFREIFNGGWKVIRHRKGGVFMWDRDAVNLYLSESQKNGQSVQGNVLLEELSLKPILNATVLEFLLENRDMIPKQWESTHGESKAIFFWGTIFRDKEDRDGVFGLSYMKFIDDRSGFWILVFLWLSDEFRFDDFAVLRAQ